MNRLKKIAIFFKFIALLCQVAAIIDILILYNGDGSWHDYLMNNWFKGWMITTALLTGTVFILIIFIYWAFIHPFEKKKA